MSTKEDETAPPQPDTETEQPSNDTNKNKRHKPKKLKNSAFIFIKPHANKESVRALVRSKLLDTDMKITFECSIFGDQINKQKLIDRHYHSISNKALNLLPKDVKVPESMFYDFFSEKWQKVLCEYRAVNARGACNKFDCSVEELDTAWRLAEENKKVVKLGGGLYCGLLSVKDEPPLYVINGFYLSMRDKFTMSNASIHCYVAEWNPGKLTWADFRKTVLGSTDPNEADTGSLRRIILERYSVLGLDVPPDKTHNAIHGSASPFEGLAEKYNWIGRKLIDDDFGKALLARGLTETLLTEWFQDPYVDLPPNGKKGSVFDYIEDTDADECMDKLVCICDYGLEKVRHEGDCTCQCSLM